MSMTCLYLQDDAAGVDRLVDKHACQRREMVGILGREVLAGAAAISGWRCR